MKYVIIAYLRNIKGLQLPYDFFICTDLDTFQKNIDIVKKSMGLRYSYFEAYKHIGLKNSHWGFKL